MAAKPGAEGEVGPPSRSVWTSCWRWLMETQKGFRAGSVCSGPEAGGGHYESAFIMDLCGLDGRTRARLGSYSWESRREIWGLLCWMQRQSWDWGVGRRQRYRFKKYLGGKVILGCFSGFWSKWPGDWWWDSCRAWGPWDPACPGGSGVSPTRNPESSRGEVSCRWLDGQIQGSGERAKPSTPRGTFSTVNRGGVTSLPSDAGSFPSSWLGLEFASWQSLEPVLLQVWGVKTFGGSAEEEEGLRCCLVKRWQSDSSLKTWTRGKPHRAGGGVLGASPLRPRPAPPSTASFPSQQSPEGSLAPRVLCGPETDALFRGRAMRWQQQQKRQMIKDILFRLPFQTHFHKVAFLEMPYFRKIWMFPIYGALACEMKTSCSSNLSHQIWG